MVTRPHHPRCPGVGCTLGDRESHSLAVSEGMRRYWQRRRQAIEAWVEDRDAHRGDAASGRLPTMDEQEARAGRAEVARRQSEARRRQRRAGP